MPRKDTNVDIEKICKMYLNGNGLETICSEVHLGKLRVKQILLDNNIEIKKKGAQTKHTHLVVEDWKIKKYEDTDEYHYVAKVKDTGEIIDDAHNQGGHLTTYIEQHYGIETPTLYDRRVYYMKTGNYWWEQWFDIIKEQRKNVKKCPYCDWTSEDVENRGGAMVNHIKNKHNKTIDVVISEFPDMAEYFHKQKTKFYRMTKLTTDGYYTICPICGERLEKITYTHIVYRHGLNYNGFKKTNEDAKLMSDAMVEQVRSIVPLSNMFVSKNRFVSKLEREISSYIETLGFKVECNRQILGGREIDILIPSKRIGIEFDGLQWHTEWFGHKKPMYHLEKTLLCNNNGYGLIHVFEDEYVNTKEIVLNKIAHILGCSSDSQKIMGRKCQIVDLSHETARFFLNKYHIQGFVKSSAYLGAMYNGIIVAVMCFKIKNNADNVWELTRFASDYNYICQGVGGKLFKKFLTQYKPNTVVSFADRRWTVNINDNLYTKMGFVLDGVNKPDYKYYNAHVDKFKRYHKMSFRKQKLHKKYGFPLEMTETEMVKQLGYDRIWDCGLIRYVWKDDKKG